jgi:hypothetical protein
MLETEYDQSNRSVTVSSTAAYAGGRPATWIVDVPDLTSAGYDPTWGLQAGNAVEWEVTGVGGTNFGSFLGAALVDNAQISAGVVVGSTGGPSGVAMMRAGQRRSMAKWLRLVP